MKTINTSKNLHLFVPLPCVPAFTIRAVEQGEFEIASAALAALLHFSKLFNNKDLDDLAFELVCDPKDDTYVCNVVVMGETEPLE